MCKMSKNQKFWPLEGNISPVNHLCLRVTCFSNHQSHLVRCNKKNISLRAYLNVQWFGSWGLIWGLRSLIWGLRPDLGLRGLIWSLRSLIWGLGGLIWGVRGLIWGVRGLIWGLRGLIWGLKGLIWDLKELIWGGGGDENDETPDRKNCPVWNHRSSAPLWPLPKKDDFEPEKAVLGPTGLIQGL